MILIASAAFVNSEFQVEFGKLPPAFLPVGNRRLFELQIKLFKRFFPYQDIYLSIPNTFTLSPMDEAYIHRMGVALLRNADDLNLADSIALALQSSKQLDDSLYLLHGDTLFVNLPVGLDLIGISKTNSDYNWEVDKIGLEKETIWSGYFAISNIKEFLFSLSNSGGNFSTAVRLYDQQISLARIDMGEWFDFGHINTYFNSRAKITTERSFNSLVIKDGCVKKTGEYNSKIEAEGNWYLKLPAPLKLYCPQLIQYQPSENLSPAYYLLEYLPLPPLNEVFVHGKNSVLFWENIFRLIANFFSLCLINAIGNYKFKEVSVDFYGLVNEKTWARLDNFIDGSSYPSMDVPNNINGNITPSLKQIIEECIRKISKCDASIGVLHGDLCLSNILFDSRLGRIKVVDPRGMNASGQITFYGDLKYDLAKLTHSVIGLYDHIIAGAYSLDRNYGLDICSFELKIYIDERTEAVQKSFMNCEFLPGLKPIDVIPLTILLFISMLPLHADEPHRQDALLANALRLYAKFL